MDKRYMNANRILREKTVPQMTMPEIDVVLTRCQDALFENSLKTVRHVDMKKRAVGEWALKIFKDKVSNNFVTRGRIRDKYRNDINYFLRNKELPQPTKTEAKIYKLMDDIENEVFWRKVGNLLSVDI